MKIRIKTQRAYDPTIRHMAQEAGISIEDVAEIAVYNLIAIWLKEHGVTKFMEGSALVTRPPSFIDVPDR